MPPTRPGWCGIPTCTTISAKLTAPTTSPTSQKRSLDLQFTCVSESILFERPPQRPSKQLSQYVLEQQDGNQSLMLRPNDSQEGSGEAADLNETKCTTPAESTSELDEGPETRGVCFQHGVLDNVVMVKRRGPCSIKYNAARGEGGVLREVVVSRKCAEAVLRGAHVFVPSVLACSGRIEKDELVAVSVAMERPDGEGG